jgi:hypothetical protein
MKAGTRRLGVALTWDGARWPRRALPDGAQRFLGGRSPGLAELTRRMAADEVDEIRVCWVPRLKGGNETLNGPFVPGDGRRLKFQATNWRRFGEVLAVTYRRRRAPG